MKVMLQKDVKDLGKVGEVVSVSQGFARNFLFPRGLALVASESKQKEWVHLQKLSEIKQKKAFSDREKLISELTGETVSFKMEAGEGDKLFGSISSIDIAKELQAKGFEVDKRDIHLEDQIKMLGQYEAKLVLGENLQGVITVVVEKK